MTRVIELHVCGECGFVEGERAQAGCCPNCGIASKSHKYQYELPRSVATFRERVGVLVR